MLKYLKQEANRTLTENGAATYASTGSECLDLFASIGALRRQPDCDIITRFVRTWTENPDLAMKLLFYTRDIRGGLGERRIFRVVMEWLAANAPVSVKKNLSYVAEYGRWDDLLALLDTPCEKETLAVLRRQFDQDMAALKADEPISLLGKWLPSVNASNQRTIACAKQIARFLNMTEAEYRKALTTLRARIRIIENNLREKDYTFDYAKQPSKAMFKYRKAFARNDGERYQAFLAAVRKGEAGLHADTLMPYELVAPWLTFDWNIDKWTFIRSMTAEEKDTLNATWASLPDFGGKENALAIIDTSGSMYMEMDPKPAAVALSLGLYFAERNKGAFANHFIEFSARPQLIEIKGKTFADRLQYMASFNEVANTNLEAVFDLVLAAAVKHHVHQEELPAKLILISDMEFDQCVQNGETTNFENAKHKFEAFGYKLPQIVFWNVASRNRQQPVRMNEQGVALVSGSTPRLFSMVAGELVTPYALMMEILAGERYAKIAA